MTNATLTKSDTAFTEYPVGADNYFQKREVIVSTLPLSIRQDTETNNTTVHFTSAKEYIDHLEGEIVFWEEHDPEKKLIEYTKISYLRNAKSYFFQAIDQYKSHPQSPHNEAPGLS